MFSQAQTASSSTVDNEPHRDGAENVFDADAYIAGRMARTAAATLRRLNNNTRLTIGERGPRTLGLPFRTPSPSSSRGSTKRSYESVDDGSTSVAATPHQRAMYDDVRSPTPPFPEDYVLHQQRQGVALPPVVQKEQEREPPRPLPPFDALLHNTGLNRDVAELRPQLPFAAQDHYRLRRAELAFAAPAPPAERQHRRLPSPRPGPEHFAPPLPPPPHPAGFVPAPAHGPAHGYTYHEQPNDYYQHQYQQHQFEHGDHYAHQEQQLPPLPLPLLPPPPEQRYPWVRWHDMSHTHQAAYIGGRGVGGPLTGGHGAVGWAYWEG